MGASMSDIQQIDDLCRKGWKIQFYYSGLNVVAACARRAGSKPVYADHPDCRRLIDTLHDKIHEQGDYAKGYADDSTK